MLDLEEKITISSFLIALTKVPQPLPADLQDEINNLGQKYTQEQKAPIAQLQKLAEKDFLKEHYWRERLDIQNLYQPREQKYDPNTQKPVPKTLENIAVPVPLEQIENLAIEILIAANSCEAARKNKEKIDKASRYYDIWRELFCCRHKIMWAYKNGIKLKTSLLKKYKDGLEENSNLDDLLKKDLPKIKEELTKNIKNMRNYVREINVMAIQQHTLEINLYNYEIILKDLKDELHNNNNEFLVKFRDIVNDLYKLQLDKDYQSLNPGLKILENLTATLSGMVAIDQAQRDRHLNTSIAIAGVGLATSQIASAVIIAQQQNSPEKVPFYQTQALWYSIGTGAIASFAFWIILSLLIKIIHRLRS